MRSLSLILLVVALLAGCVGGGDDSDPAPQESVEDPEGEGATLQRSTPSDPTVPQAPSDNGTTPLQNITAFYWGTDADLGDVAMEVRIDFGEENECEIYVGNLGQRNGSGASAVAIFAREDGAAGWGSSGGGSSVHVRTAGVDTDDVLAPSGGYGSISGTGGVLSGEYTITRVAMGVGLVEGLEEFTSGQSLFLQADCGKPFDVLGARVGFGAQVADQRLDSGTYADVSPVGNVALDAALESEVLSGEGHVRFGSFGDQVGEVTLASPEASRSYMVPLEEDGHLMGGPGTYSVQLQRAAVYIDAFWAAVYGLSDEVDLVPGLHDGPFYESPF